MSHSSEVAIVLGQPDYDLPLASPVARDGGLAVTGADGLSYLWRFDGERAALWAIEHGTVGRALGALRIEPPATGTVALEAAQARMRRVQTAYVQLAETLLSMAGETARPALRAMRDRLAGELLMFTDPADDGAHAELRPMPDVTGIEAAPEADRERLRPLALILLRQNEAVLGIDDPEEFLASATRGAA